MDVHIECKNIVTFNGIFTQIWYNKHVNDRNQYVHVRNRVQV